MEKNKMLEMMKKHAKEAKAACKLKRIADPEDTEPYAEELLTEITMKVLVAGNLGKDLSPLYSILEQTKEIVSDVLGDDNFDI